MQDHAETKTLALARSGTMTTVWTVTRAEAAAVAEGRWPSCRTGQPRSTARCHEADAPASRRAGED